MKKRSTLMNAIALVVVVAGLAIVIAALQTRRVQALQDSEDFPSDFGFFDLAAGQTARLSLVNSRVNSPPEPDQPPPEPDNPGDLRHARRVRFSFDIFVSPPPDPDANSCATRYRFARREFCDVVLRPGEAASFDFTATEDVKVAASVRSLGGPDTRERTAQLTPEPHLAPTLQVREGVRTLFVLPGVAKGFNPQPDPPGQQ